MTAAFDKLVAACDRAMWDQAHQAMTFNDNEQGRLLKAMQYRDLPPVTLSQRQSTMKRLLQAVIPAVCEELTTRALQLSDGPYPDLEHDPLSFFEGLVEALKVESQFS